MDTSGLSPVSSIGRWIGAGFIATASIAVSADGTFERWWNRSSAWLTNDAERVTLAHQVARYRPNLPGYRRVLEIGEPGYEAWIEIACRARDPAEEPQPNHINDLPAGRREG